MPFPHLIQYWHDAEPPSHVAATLASAATRNPGIEQLVFDAEGARALIEEHHGPRHAAAFRACGPAAMQADYFRYCAVHALGGVYADANFRWLGSLADLLGGNPCGFLFGREDPVPRSLATLYNWPHPVGRFRAVNNNVFGFAAPGHPLLELAIEVATANIEQRVADGPRGVWVGTGPGVFTAIYLLCELGSIDAFASYTAESMLAPSVETFCEAVRKSGAAADLLEGVEILPFAQRDAWLVKERGPDDTQWMTFEGTIYK